MTLIVPTMKLGLIARRHPETVDVFEWHDIDVDDRRHTTVESLAEELDIQLEVLVDEIVESLLDPDQEPTDDDDLEDELGDEPDVGEADLDGVDSDLSEAEVEIPEGFGELD